MAYQQYQPPMSLYQMLMMRQPAAPGAQQPQQTGWASMPWWQQPQPFGSSGDSSDSNQTDQGSQDQGSQQGAGNTSYGWTPPDWMRGMAGKGSMSNKQAMQMGMLGLGMMQPRQPTHTGPYPWI